MDGVILNSMPFHAQAWQNVFKNLGLEITREEVYAHEGETGEAALRKFLEKRGRKISPDEAGKLLALKREEFKRIVKIEVFPGVVEFLEKLLHMKKCLAIVTGTARQELVISLPTEILQLFQVIITGDEVKQGKPAPEPYILALEKLQLKAEQAIVIENAPLGIESAKSANMICLALTTSLDATCLKAADMIFKNIQEAANYLGEKFKIAIN